MLPTPLAPGDVDYAISLVMPVNAEGLRLLPRRPYATLATSVYDYPLSARYDEVDTTVVFDDVFVPCTKSDPAFMVVVPV